MVVMAVHRVPSLTQARYGGGDPKLTNGKSRRESLRSPVRRPPRACQRSQSNVSTKRWARSPREVGIEEPPEFIPAHTFVYRPAD